MRPNIVSEVDFTFFFIMGISAILLLIITVAMLYFVYKYSKKRNPVASNIENNTTIEIIWTVIPVILVLVMFYISWTGFKNMRDVPKDAMVVTVTGQMWRWSFEYDNKKKSDTLYLPVNKNIKFELKSQDVIHSFYLPAFRCKEDVVPGRTNYYWIRTTETGHYYATCAEYCGLNHSNMYAKIIVIPDDEFEAWKNYVPPDTTKKDSAVKTDSLKTTSSVSDTAKTEGKVDTLKKTSPSSDMKKTDTTKK